MDNSSGRPTPAEAAAALRDAEASRATLAGLIDTPSWFFTSLGAAIATRIATTAFGLGDGATWVPAAGLAVFAIVAATQLGRFRRRNGVRLGGFASRVVLGTATAASASYTVALGLAIWAAYDARWWLVAICAVGGVAAYALSGGQWMRAYRARPAAHATGESATWLALLAGLAVAGLVLLLINA